MGVGNSLGAVLMFLMFLYTIAAWSHVEAPLAGSIDVIMSTSDQTSLLN